jgi:endonuclease/exonuclease/phosphatase family metal-dependent hydrolase
MIISSHVKPVSGVSDMTTEDEINCHTKVYDQALLQQPTITNAIIAGDFNADCDYVADLSTIYEGTGMTEANGYYWKIDESADTTVKTTDCAYDRIVVKGTDFVEDRGVGRVFDYATFYDTENIEYCDPDCEPITELVSDHFPVEMYLH